jgi:hypothetical protein
MSSESQTSTSCNAPTSAEEDEEIRRVFGDSKTIGEFLRRDYQRRLEPLLMSVPNGDKVLRHILRIYEPWPDWVLRIAVEVWSVHFPTIKKEVIYDSVRFAHAFFFEMQLGGSTPAEPPKFTKIDSRVLGAMIGHASVMPHTLRSTADEALRVGALSQEKYAEYAEQFSSESFQAKMQPHLTNYFKARPNKWLGVCEAISEAKRKTLDEHGELKETTLTKVYAAILRDWEEIEELSGPTELCTFLKLVLDGSENDPEKKLDRVKKICRRMGIQFRPVVKGQTHPPTLSLPPAD